MQKNGFLSKKIYNIISSQWIYNIVECQMQLIEWKQVNNNNKILNSTTTEQQKFLNSTSAQLNNRIKKNNKILNITIHNNITKKESHYPFSYTLTYYIYIAYYMFVTL